MSWLDKVLDYLMPARGAVERQVKHDRLMAQADRTLDDIESGRKSVHVVVVDRQAEMRGSFRRAGQRLVR